MNKTEVISYILSQREIEAPAVQNEFSLSYCDVKEILDKLVCEGRIEFESGVKYKIVSSADCKRSDEVPYKPKRSSEREATLERYKEMEAAFERRREEYRRFLHQLEDFDKEEDDGDEDDEGDEWDYDEGDDGEWDYDDDDDAWDTGDDDEEEYEDEEDKKKVLKRLAESLRRIAERRERSECVDEDYYHVDDDNVFKDFMESVEEETCLPFRDWVLKDIEEGLRAVDDLDNCMLWIDGSMPFHVKIRNGIHRVLSDGGMVMKRTGKSERKIEKELKPFESVFLSENGEIMCEIKSPKATFRTLLEFYAAVRAVFLLNN